MIIAFEIPLQFSLPEENGCDDWVGQKQDHFGLRPSFSFYNRILNFFNSFATFPTYF